MLNELADPAPAHQSPPRGFAPSWSPDPDSSLPPSSLNGARMTFPRPQCIHRPADSRRPGVVVRHQLPPASRRRAVPGLSDVIGCCCVTPTAAMISLADSAVTSMISSDAARLSGAPGMPSGTVVPAPHGFCAIPSAQLALVMVRLDGDL